MEDLLLAPQRNHMIGVHIVVLMDLVRWCDDVFVKVSNVKVKEGQG